MNRRLMTTTILMMAITILIGACKARQAVDPGAEAGEETLSPTVTLNDDAVNVAGIHVQTARRGPPAEGPGCRGGRVQPEALYPRHSPGCRQGRGDRRYPGLPGEGRAGSPDPLQPRIPRLSGGARSGPYPARQRPEARDVRGGRPGRSHVWIGPEQAPSLRAHRRGPRGR